jgi:hypothetical protein
VKKSELKALLKEEIKRILRENENMFEKGETVMYMGEPHQVLSDDGYVVKLVSTKRGTKVTLNYSQAKERIQPLKENQDLRNLNMKDITPGKYHIFFTTEGDSGGGDMIVTVTQNDIDNFVKYETKDENGEISSFNFWRGFIFNDPFFERIFYRGDKVQSVKKLESQSFNESLTPEEKEELYYLEDELLYAVKSRSAINPKMVARYDELKRKREEASKK